MILRSLVFPNLYLKLFSINRILKKQGVSSAIEYVDNSRKLEDKTSQSIPSYVFGSLESVLKYYISSTKCLEKALLIRYVFNLYKVPSKLVFLVKNDPFGAHVFVEHELGSIDPLNEDVYFRIREVA